ncbi:MAG: response regulator [Rhodospirillales bacterium]|nr:response regulator [Rhodospirillales bacterium]
MSIVLSDLKILLVEDQSEARAMVRNMLAELGITQIFEASNGREALTFLDSAYDFIDLLVCDWNMPGLTGVELLRQLRSVDPTMPFLMVTGRSDKESVVEAKSAGVTAYIAKPFSSKELEAKLRVILHKMAA